MSDNELFMLAPRISVINKLYSQLFQLEYYGHNHLYRFQKAFSLISKVGGEYTCQILRIIFYLQVKVLPRHIRIKFAIRSVMLYWMQCLKKIPILAWPLKHSQKQDLWLSPEKSPPRPMSMCKKWFVIL